MLNYANTYTKNLVHTNITVHGIFSEFSPPRNVVVTDELNKLHVTWAAPEYWQYCISNYSLYITDTSGAISVVNTTDTTLSYSVDKPCSDAVIQVSGWSKAGEGERSSPVEFERGEIHVHNT